MNILGVLIAIVLFLILIVVHEFGHFAAAKISGVGVDEFSVGMGPLIFSKEKNGTQYSLRAVPLGGYCKLSGEEGEETSSMQDGSAFNNAPWYKKLFISFSGPFNNLVLCLLILFFVFLYLGAGSSTLAKVNPGSPADLAGIKAGDTLVAVDGTYYDSWNEIVGAISNSKDEISLSYLRDGKEFTANVIPEFNEAEGRKLIGINCKIIHSPGLAIKESFEVATGYFKEIGLFFKELLSGHTENTEIVGVVGMVSLVSEEVQYGMINVIYLIALLSLNLGVINLLPIPGLDGGKILITILRVISFGKITEKAERTADAIGMALLLALALFLIFKDTFNLIF